MIVTYAATAVALVLLGAAIGFMAVVSLAIHRDKHITTPATDRLARGARTVNRLHTRGRGALQEAAYRHDLPRHTGQDW
jgi:hypothetical protein